MEKETCCNKRNGYDMAQIRADMELIIPDMSQVEREMELTTEELFEKISSLKINSDGNDMPRS